MKWVKASERKPVVKDNQRVPARMFGIYDTILFTDGWWCWLRGDQVNDIRVRDKDWEDIEWLDETNTDIEEEVVEFPELKVFIHDQIKWHSVEDATDSIYVALLRIQQQTLDATAYKAIQFHDWVTKRGWEIDFGAQYSHTTAATKYLLQLKQEKKIVSDLLDQLDDTKKLLYAERERAGKLMEALVEVQAGSLTGQLTRPDMNKVASKAINEYNNKP